MADKNEDQKPEGEQHTHIQSEPKEEEEEKNTSSGGLLSKIGDPIGMFSSLPPSSPPKPCIHSRPHTELRANARKGNVLGTALRPIGAPLEKGVTGPLGNALGGTTKPALGPLMGHEEEKSEYLGGKNVDSYSKPEKVSVWGGRGIHDMGMKGGNIWWIVPWQAYI
jgi:hypothetical protein